MPGKSRHKRGKRSPQSKKREIVQRSSGSVVQHQAVAQNREPVFHPSVSVSSASVATPVVKLTAARYPHITTELRTIGILAAILLIILIVLALALA